jgi:hypothetical protein
MLKKISHTLPMVLALALTHCDLDATSSSDQPLVDYVVAVTDSLTQGPLDSVHIHVKTIAGDTFDYYTDAQEGRATLATLASSRTTFHLSRPGYSSLDFLDTVNAQPDTVFHRALDRILHLKMNRINLGEVLPEELPKDTLLSSDSLIFHFKKAVALIERVSIRVTNIGDQDVDVTLDSTRTKLRMVPKGGLPWAPGRHYDYEIVLRDANGKIFRTPYDSTPSLRGSFFIREEPSPTETSFLFRPGVADRS